MHGAGHWMAFNAFNSGNTVVIQDEVTRLEPDQVWELVQREGINVLLIVGDAFGRPLVDALEHLIALPSSRLDGTLPGPVDSSGLPLDDDVAPFGSPR